MLVGNFRNKNVRFNDLQHLVLSQDFLLYQYLGLFMFLVERRSEFILQFRDSGVEYTTVHSFFLQHLAIPGSNEVSKYSNRNQKKYFTVFDYKLLDFI